MFEEQIQTEAPIAAQNETQMGGDVERLMAALQKERDARSSAEKEAKQYRAQVDAFSGVDPELAKKAQQILAQQEEFAQRESKLKAEIEGQYQPKLSEAQKQIAETEAKLLNYQRDVTLEREFVRAGGFEGEFQAIAHALRDRVQLGVNGEQKILDFKGQPAFVKGEPMTLSQLIEEMKTTQLWFARHFKGHQSSGAGLNGSARGTTFDPSLQGLSSWQKVERQRSQGS